MYPHWARALFWVLGPQESQTKVQPSRTLVGKSEDNDVLPRSGTELTSIPPRSLGGYNKIPQTGWFKEQMFISLSGGWMSKIRVSADPVSGGHHLPGLQADTHSPRPHKVEREWIWDLFLLI